MSHTIAVAPERPFPLRLLLCIRLAILTAVYIVLFTASYAIAYGLRFEFALPGAAWQVFLATLPWIVPVKLAVFYVTGNYFGWWRYITFSDLSALLRATTVALLTMAAIDYFALRDLQIPRSILLLDWGLTILLVGGLRSCSRLSREHFWPMVRRAESAKALIVGADEQGVLLASRIHHDSQLPFRIAGFLDSDRRKQGTCLGGIPVLGGLDEIGALAAAHSVQYVLVMAGSLPGKVMRQLLTAGEQAGLQVKVIPGFNELLHGKHVMHVRDVDINDLLRREPVQLDSDAIGQLLKDRTVMVTGAGGSIGSEICRQVLKFQPARLVLVEKSENSLFFIERELQALDTATTLHACIADILDEPRMRHLFAEHRPAVVFHAAAHKHVPMMQTNPGEAIKNNVFGTKHVADLAHEFGTQSFVLISTDKAVKPTSVMGATKQFAERYVHALSQESKTKFVVVRFGNVLGSAGSVVPIFQEQIRRGGPITITDERMTRYFMTIPEASQLVLQASAMGHGGEIFVLEMGEPVKIVDLATDLIRLSGLAPDTIDIVYSGIRPGEKLFEELYFSDEQTLPTHHPKLRAAYHRPYTLAEVSRDVTELGQAANGSEKALYQALTRLVVDFKAFPNDSPDRVLKRRCPAVGSSNRFVQPLLPEGKEA